MVFSGLRRLTKEEVKYGAITPLSFISSKTFSFEISSALLFLIEISFIVFVKPREVSLIVSVGGSYKNFQTLMKILFS